MAYNYGQPPSTVRWDSATSALVCTWIDNRSGISISADSSLGETLNRGPLVLLLRRQYEFPFGVKIVQFSFFSIVHNVIVIVRQG